jgi:hypothetical protein
MPAKLHELNSRAVRLIAALGLLSTAAPATAQTVQSISPSAPDLGDVVSAASGETVFRVSASTGAVTTVSGTGARLGTGTTRALVTIFCSGGGLCTNRDINVRVGSLGSGTGRAGELNNFTVAPNSATFRAAPTGTNPVSFALAPLGANGTATFWVGADFPIRGNESGAATGNASSGFYVHVIFAPNTPTAGSNSGLAVARVFRPINIVASSNLAFGRIVRPTSGSGTVTINAGTGARTVSGTGVVGLTSPTPTRALYTVSGEGGQAFSLSHPASFQMTGPGTPLVVSLTSTASGTRTLGSAIGSTGTFTLAMGGSFPISSTTPTGLYQGTYQVTVQYN